MLTLLKWLPTIVKFGIPLGIVGGVYLFGWSFVDEYRGSIQSAELAKIEQRKLQARYDSEFRMRTRRDEAIAASKCAAQIKDWVRNPHKIPKPFDPFNNSPLSTPSR